MSSNLKEFLLVPNLLGYCRVLLALVAFYFMPTYPNVIFAYVGSVVISGIDALSAKFLSKATSPFGAVQHLVSDRIMTLGLMMIVAMLYPHYLLLYQSLVILDIVSHWMQHYSSILRGQMSHKDSTNMILQLFYYNQIVVGVVHIGNELYLVTLFAMYFTAGNYYTFFNYENGLYEWLSFAFLPIFATKQLMNIIQLFVAAREIASFGEMVVWLGIGPFEGAVHSLGLLVFSILLTLKVEMVINSTWHLLFLPLYMALFIDAYYNAILVTRMALYSVKKASNRVFSVGYSAMTILRLAVLLYFEIQTATYLNSPSTTAGSIIIPPLTLLLMYLSLRFLLLYRTIPNND